MIDQRTQTVSRNGGPSWCCFCSLLVVVVVAAVAVAVVALAVVVCSLSLYFVCCCCRVPGRHCRCHTDGASVVDQWSSQISSFCDFFGGVSCHALLFNLFV